MKPNHICYVLLVKSKSSLSLHTREGAAQECEYQQSRDLAGSLPAIAAFKKASITHDLSFEVESDDASKVPGMMPGIW